MLIRIVRSDRYTPPSKIGIVNPELIATLIVGFYFTQTLQ